VQQNLTPSQNLVLAGISKSFGSRKVLDDLHLLIPSQSIFFIVGPSGCGKTTALRIIAGLETPDRGDVRIGAESVLATPPAKRGIGLVFQNYGLWPHMSVLQHLEFALISQKMNREQKIERISKILSIVGLQEFSQSMPSQLSGGQQQRLALARSLSLVPNFLLLDEPFSNLDLKLRRQVISSLRMIREKFKMTVVIISHDIESVITPDDYIAVLDAGRVLQTGLYQDVVANPMSRQVSEALNVEDKR